ncbi:MAG: RpiB/LacA/LacB family sugar-phosphate isomerase, partial [Tepidiformaceae bacterium]
TARSLGHEIVDFGTYNDESVDYPDFAEPVARAVVDGEADLGVVLCSTGVGVSITANKVPGARCALCHTSWGASRARLHANANVLALGAWEIGRAVADDILVSFLREEFDQAPRNERRLSKLTKVEARGIGAKETK